MEAEATSQERIPTEVREALKMSSQFSASTEDGGIDHTALSDVSMGQRIQRLIGPNLVFDEARGRVVPVDHFSILDPMKYASNGRLPSIEHWLTQGVLEIEDRFKERVKPLAGGQKRTSEVLRVMEEIEKDSKGLRDIIPWIGLTIFTKDPVSHMNEIDSKVRSGTTVSTEETKIIEALIRNAVRYVADPSHQRPPKKLGMLMTVLAEEKPIGDLLDQWTSFRSVLQFDQNYDELLPIYVADVVDKMPIPSPFINAPAVKRAARLTRAVAYTALMQNMYKSLVLNSDDQSTEAQNSRSFYGRLLRNILMSSTGKYDRRDWKQFVRGFTKLHDQVSKAKLAGRSSRRSERARRGFEDQYDGYNRYVMGLQLLSAINAAKVYI